MMSTYKYTLQMDSNKHLHMLQEDGKEVSVMELLEKCAPRKVIALDAPMGTGKTTLIKQLCESMGTEDIVNSPTFAIVNVYEMRDGNEVYHFDCYRLKDIREAVDFGAEEYLYSGRYCFIEWPEIIEPILPEDTQYIHIRTLENGNREISFEIP